MPKNFDWVSNRVSPSPEIMHPPQGKGCVIAVGDPVVLTTKSTLTNGGVVICRTLLAADIAAVYKESTPIAGLLGFAGWTQTTDSNGRPIAVAPSGVAADAMPVYPLPGLGGSLDSDPTSKFARIKVFLATETAIFKGKLKTGSADSTLLNTAAGIDLTASAFTVDTGAATKLLTIVGWDALNPAWVFFQVQPAYCQSKTFVNYATN